ncbi:MAG: phosphodiesterase [Alphaproteobacteria bacterium]
MKFIHLTDPHIVGEGLSLFGTCPTKRLNLTVNSINAEHSDAAFVIITGDLTHWGEDDAYKALRNALDRLTVPVRLLVGNHDRRGDFLNYFPEAVCDEHGFIQSRFAMGDLSTGLILDTTLEGTHAGHYCATRCQWLERQLDEIDGDVILFMHHHPVALGVAAMDRIMLQEHEQFWQVLRGHTERIRHIFFGHVHRAVSGHWRGIPFSSVRGLNHQVHLNLEADDSAILGDLASPTYGVVLLRPDSLVMHLHDFTDSSPRFPLHQLDGDDPRSYALTMSHPGWVDIVSSSKE